MDYDHPMGPRPMVDISSLGITCAECGGPIDKLPFEPTKKEDGTYGRLYCYECNKARVGIKPGCQEGGFLEIKYYSHKKTLPRGSVFLL